MAEKFEKLYGRFKVTVGGKEYPFVMTLRQRGIFSNLRAKYDSEDIIMFLFQRFRDGFLASKAMEGKEPSQEEISLYEDELGNWLLLNYDSILTEVFVELGITTREKIKEMEAKASDPDFLSGMAVKKMNELGEKAAQR